MAKRNEKGSLFLLAAIAAAFVVLAAQVKPAAAIGYTAAIETIVNEEVTKAKDKAPGLVRLLFHDCFVKGCDGSVLLTSTPFNSSGKTEQNSASNGGLRGLEVIDAIRTRFAQNGIVASCADTVVFAAREATKVLSNGNIVYDIDGPGRDDGVVSSDQDPGQFLPGPTFNFDQLLASFAAKGFNVTELVALSGAHGIGVTHLSSFSDRLDSAVLLRNEIAAKYQDVIKKESTANPGGAFKNNIRDMGRTAQRDSGYKTNQVNLAAVDVLDNSFYNANLQNMVRFKSDWELRTNAAAAQLMQTYKTDAITWSRAFGAAMTKLSNTLKAEGTRFEIGSRVKCSSTNFDSQDSYPSV